MSRPCVVSTVLAALVSLVPAPGCAENSAAPRVEKVRFESDGLTLVGYLYYPTGVGSESARPWPALVWNHGSEKDPGAGPQFAAVASVFVPGMHVWAEDGKAFFRANLSR